MKTVIIDCGGDVKLESTIVELIARHLEHSEMLCNYECDLQYHVNNNVVTICTRMAAQRVAPPEVIDEPMDNPQTVEVPTAEVPQTEVPQTVSPAVDYPLETSVLLMNLDSNNSVKAITSQEQNNILCADNVNSSEPGIVGFCYVGSTYFRYPTIPGCVEPTISMVCCINGQLAKAEFIVRQKSTEGDICVVLGNTLSQMVL